MTSPGTTVGSDAAEGSIDDRTTDGRRWFGSLGSVVLLLVLTWSAGIASFPLNDNSFLTHLATGRIILDDGRVPSSDPYTFTAAGEPWTVQSWLPSVVYAAAERLAADVGLRLVVLALFLAAAVVLWKLTGPVESLLVRLALVTLALVVATDLWGERPYMVGVIGLGVVWLALDGRVAPWALVPMLWAWVNSHGSFPLALVLVLAVAAGSALDRRAAGLPLAMPDLERRVLVGVVAGTLLGAVSPVGPRLLWFPLTALSKGEVFSAIIEWRPPEYVLLSERAFLVLLAVALLLMVRRGSWRLAVPAVVFGLSAVYAQRNVVMATIVLVAVAAASAPAAGSLRPEHRPRLGPGLASLTAALFVLVSLAAVASPAPGFGGYPVHALGWLDAAPLDGRVATEIPGGNLLEVLDGPRRQVFIDDRADMFPVEVFEDYLELVAGSPQWTAVLDRYEVDVVVWDRSAPLAALLATSADWTVRYTDTQAVVACRRARCAPVS